LFLILCTAVADYENFKAVATNITIAKIKDGITSLMMKFGSWFCRTVERKRVWVVTIISVAQPVEGSILTGSIVEISINIIKFKK
jgi:hypothetical protein